MARLQPFWGFRRKDDLKHTAQILYTAESFDLPIGTQSESVDHPFRHDLLLLDV